jgi:hypothetical protein
MSKSGGRGESQRTMLARRSVKQGGWPHTDALDASSTCRRRSAAEWAWWSWVGGREGVIGANTAVLGFRGMDGSE